MFFQAKPIVIEAVQWTGDNVAELAEFAGEIFRQDSGEDPNATGKLYDEYHSVWLPVYNTDWITKDEVGQYHLLTSSELTTRFIQWPEKSDTPRKHGPWFEREFVEDSSLK